MQKQVQQRHAVTKDSEKELQAESKKLQRLGWELDGPVRKHMSGVRWVQKEYGPYDEEYGNAEKVQYAQYTQRYVKFKEQKA